MWDIGFKDDVQMLKVEESLGTYRNRSQSNNMILNEPAHRDAR